MEQFALDRVRSLMAEQDIEALLVTEQSNLQYLTGIHDVSGMLLVTLEDHRLVTAKFFRYSAGIDTVYTDQEERTRLREELTAEAQAADADLEGVDETDLLTAARRIKQPAELDRIREAAAIGDAGFGAVLDGFEPGMTEGAVAALADTEIRQEGAFNSFDTLVHASTTEPHRGLRPEQIEAGETVLTDLGARYGGYCSDMTRMVPNDCAGEQRELIDAVAELQSLALDHVRAGMAIGELAGLVEERVPELGYSLDEHYLHSLGHGVGVAIHEGPSLHADADGELQENMVVTIEPGLYVPGVGGARIEDQVIVTDEGYERVTRQERITERS